MGIEDIKKEDDTYSKFGSTEGPEAMYVKLISADNYEFIVKREHALTSGTIKAMLSGPDFDVTFYTVVKDNVYPYFISRTFSYYWFGAVLLYQSPPHPLPHCRSHVLQKVCMYFTYKVRYTNSSAEIPEFPIAPEVALELLMAANFLDC